MRFYKINSPPQFVSFTEILSDRFLIYTRDYHLALIFKKFDIPSHSGCSFFTSCIKAFLVGLQKIRVARLTFVFPTVCGFRYLFLRLQAILTGFDNSILYKLIIWPQLADIINSSNFGHSKKWVFENSYKCI